MSEIATLRQRLAEAETALHRHTLGEAVVVSQRDGRRIEFAIGGAEGVRQLQAYIANLKAEIASLEGSGPTRRPVSFSF